MQALLALLIFVIALAIGGPIGYLFLIAAGAIAILALWRMA